MNNLTSIDKIANKAAVDRKYTQDCNTTCKELLGWKLKMQGRQPEDNSGSMGL